MRNIFATAKASVVVLLGLLLVVLGKGARAV